MSLNDYHAKRDFAATPEPTGGEGSGPLRFVIQKHHASHLHYDFRLEMGGILKSWAIPKGPSLNPADKHLAMMTEDHPYDYRTFEGTIPAGNYGAGTVMVWDEGTYEPLGAAGDRHEDDRLARQGVHAGHLTFYLHGTKLRGEFALIKMKHADEDNAWLLVKADKDQWATSADVTKQDHSAVTGRTLEEIAANTPVTQLRTDADAAPEASLPDQVQPMLATLCKDPFEGPDWLYEIKWDGYRILARLDAGGVTLNSRRGQDYTKLFQPVADELHRLQVPALIDGEMVVVDEHGRSSFQALQQFIRTGHGQLVYYAFDLIHLDGHDLSKLPLVQRKQLLHQVLPSGPHIRYSDHIYGQGLALLSSVKSQGLEGIIAKRTNSSYHLGERSQDWLKFKLHHRQEAVIIGYTQPRTGRQFFGALVLAVYKKDRLVPVGHTGSGFTDADLTSIYQQLQPLRTDACPVDPAPPTNEPAQWVKPELVCEVEFTEWTADGSMRHPIFVGLRDDKPAREVTPEESTASTSDAPTSRGSGPSEDSRVLDGHQLRLTHLDKVFWPEEAITKGQLIDYYQTVANTLLPYLRDRPQSLHRYPNGIAGEGFYHKDMAGRTPAWIRTQVIHSESENRDLEYLLCQDTATLIYMINLGCIELNPWNSRLDHVDQPDWCVIDLDPEAVGFEAVITTAQAVHTVLQELGLPSYPKTSGASGLHIYIPLGAQYTYDQVKLFAQLLAQLAHARVPDITSLERSPAKRQGKIYLDYLQNRRGQTLAAAYSVRPQPGATVSMPLHWDEVVTGLTPQQFTLHNAAERLPLDAKLWRPVMGSGIDLLEVLHKLA